jgi:hypothetical protein
LAGQYPQSAAKGSFELGIEPADLAASSMDVDSI